MACPAFATERGDAVMEWSMLSFATLQEGILHITQFFSTPPQQQDFHPAPSVQPAGRKKSSSRTRERPGANAKLVIPIR